MYSGSIRRYREEAEKSAAAAEPEDAVLLQKDRRLPPPVKFALLIIATLVLVGTLYASLRFALGAFLKAAS